MTIEAVTLPANAAPLVDARGQMTLVWRAIFANILNQLSGNDTQLAAFLEAIASLEGSAAELLASKADKSLLVKGGGSIDGGGVNDLSANRTFQLKNDSTSPPAHYVYGTDQSGVKGWVPLYAGLGDYADDAAAAVGGIAVGSPYRTGSTLKVRIA